MGNQSISNQASYSELNNNEIPRFKCLALGERLLERQSDGAENPIMFIPKQNNSKAFDFNCLLNGF